MMTSDRYTRLAIILHWVIAILLVGQLAGGLLTEQLPKGSALKFTLIQWHKSFGVLVLALTFVRLFWRLGHKPPALPASMPAWQRLAARSVHVAFYVLTISVPLVGWAYISVSPFQVPTFLFTLLPLPHLPIADLVGDREAAAHLLKEVHEYGAFAIIGLIVLHVGAALKHHFINRDAVLSTMLLRK